MKTKYLQITLDYYNKNSKKYFNNSYLADMSSIQDRFLKYLLTAGSILDFGSGSGRDMKAFLDKGFDVDGVDGSEELAKLAKELTGRDIIVTPFHLFKTDKKYDGIWACASLLHFPFDETLNYLKKLVSILKPGGILYFSLKKGIGEGIEKDRYFKYYSKEELHKLIGQLDEMVLAETWESKDTRPQEKNNWFNVILIKNEK